MFTLPLLSVDMLKDPPTDETALYSYMLSIMEVSYIVVEHTGKSSTGYVHAQLHIISM